LSETKSTEQRIEQLIVVVHGVGDPPPGSTLGSFARAMGAIEQPLVDEKQAVWLTDKPADPNYISTFPAHLCQLTAGQQRIAMAEVYWGDLTRIYQGWLGSLTGILQILFGLRYLSFVAADQPGWAAKSLKMLGRCCFRLVHGPVLAINFNLMILALAIVLLQFTGPSRFLFQITGDWILMACCLIAYGVASTGWRVTHTRVFERFWFWVKVNSLFLVGLLSLKWISIGMAPGDSQLLQAIDLVWYGRLLVIQLGLLWGGGILILQAMLICWVAAMLDRRVYRPAIHLSILLPALSIGIWSHLLLLTWLFAANRAEKIWRIQELTTIFRGAEALLGVQFAMSLLLGLIAGFSALQYVFWRQTSSVQKFQRGSHPPRLIVNQHLQWGLGISAATGSTLVLMLGIQEFTVFSNQFNWLEDLMQKSSQLAMIAIVPISFLIGFMIPKCRPLFGIALEIVNHFVFRIGSNHFRFADEDQIRVWQTRSEKSPLFFFRREFVIQRMKQVLQHHARHPTLAARPGLVLLSHSQGTIVAIETLNDPAMGWLRERFDSIHLVTMGSPFQHLYQHYFPHFYPSLETAHWDTLQSNLDFWVNIFRIDDPVGTEINFPEGYLWQHPGTKPENEDSVKPVGCINYPVGPRGHVNYWNDQEVLGILRAELFQSEGLDRSKAITPSYFRPHKKAA
jgi:hypothetical protein